MASPEPISLTSRIQGLLDEAERCVAEAGSEQFRKAVALADEALSLRQSLPPYEQAGTYFVEAYLWLVRGSAQRDLGREAQADVLNSYRKGLAALDGKAPGATPQELQLPANLWTNLGITLLRSRTPGDLKEAIECFEKAIAVRSALPRDMHNVRWGLAAGWMNRGDALTQLGTDLTLTEAVRSYDEALAILNDLAAFDHPPFVIRLAVAWMNRGHSLMSLDTPEARQEALKSFEASSEILRRSPTPEEEEHRCTLACVLMSHASVSMNMSLESLQKALDESREALTLVAPFEEAVPFAAEVGLKSRHLLCRILAIQLDRSDRDAPEAEEWMNEVTDVVDEGMKLERTWELHGIQNFRPLAGDLFYFGSRVYVIRQPHFLAEFILECLDPEVSPGAPVTSGEMHHAASAAIWDAVLEVERRSKQPENAGTHDKLIHLLDELHAVDARLATLRQTYMADASESG